MNAQDIAEQAYKNRFEDGTPKWIPVTEKLPQHNIPVLTYRKNGMVGIGYTQPANASPDGKVHFYPRIFGEVTHWLPLPIPPEAGK